VGSQNLGSKGICDFVTVLACYPAIFGHLDHLTMVAEAPDQHGGGLGRLEGGKNGLNGRNIISSIICIPDFFCIYFLIAVWKDPLQHFKN